MPQITIISFGYGHPDEPPDAHLTVDMRSFRDPHVNPALRNLTARDQAVVDAVLGTAGIMPLIDATAAMTRAFMAGPAVADHPLTVAFGCVGGRYRSAVAADQLCDVLAQNGYDVVLVHRDIDKPVIKR